MEEAKQTETITGGELRLPESPRLPMEFLSRSWSASSFQLSKTLSTSTSLHHNSKPPSSTSSSIPEEQQLTTTITNNNSAHSDDSTTTNTSGNASSSGSASSNTSQHLLLDRIMSFSEMSPMTSGRPSHSGGSPLLSPSRDLDQVLKVLKDSSISNGGGGGQQVQVTSVCRGGMVSPGGGKTVGRWLKDRREKKKEEIRVQNAQLHATVSVAGVAAAVASMAAAAAAAAANGKIENRGKLDLAVASAATLVAAHCVEAAESLGVERDQLASVVGSAVNVKCYDDILTLTAAAATALRGAATLKARVMKDIPNAAGTLIGKEAESKHSDLSNLSREGSGELTSGESPIGTSELEFLGTGRELLKRTRNGDLHWKIVSVYIHRSGEVMLKMKSKYVGGTITNKKKNVVLEVCKNMPSWPGRHLLEDGEQRRYFGLKTAVRGLVEFECKDQREHDLWTEGVSRLLAIVAARKNRGKL